MHLVLIVGDHGDCSNGFPVFGWHADTVYFFIDHRSSPQERLAAFAAVIDPAQVTSVERVFVTPPPHGVHDWRVLMQQGRTVRVRCQRCGAVETLEQAVPNYREVVSNVA